MIDVVEGMTNQHAAVNKMLNAFVFQPHCSLECVVAIEANLMNVFRIGMVHR